MFTAQCAQHRCSQSRTATTVLQHNFLVFTLGSQTRLWRSGARDQGGEGEIVGIDSVASWDEELSPAPQCCS